jgi:hypothetical protein
MYKRWITFLSLLILLSSLSYAAEITQTADKLNFWSSEQHTVTIENEGTQPTSVNISVPSGFAYDSGNCTHSAGTITCNLNAGQIREYVVNSSSSLAEYSVRLFSPTTNNSYTGNIVRFLRIKDEEIFHTLVEFGRGRGNYFFDSAFAGKAGSGHTGVGCNYVPNSTMFELNYLHKVLNVRQYFGNLTADAYNATFSCTYPNRSIVRQHLITSTQRNSSGTYVSYKINKIEGSWERMGFLGMDFYDTDQYVGEDLVINCTNMVYAFPYGGGNIVVGEDSFTLNVRDKEPFTASASSSATIDSISFIISNNR